MIEGTKWRWQFLGFESVEEGQTVQVWYNGLPEEVKDEIRDLLTYLGKMTDRLWRKPEFDGLAGAGGISELRPYGKIESETYRIYGFFPRDRPHTYIFLHGTRKGMRNDKPGKQIAARRLEQLEQGAATVHQFEF